MIKYKTKKNFIRILLCALCAAILHLVGDLLSRFINENGCERNKLGENSIWQTTSELIMTSSCKDDHVILFFFLVLREAIKSIQTERRDVFRYFGAV